MGGGQYGPGNLKSQYGSSLGNVSQNSGGGAGPAPTTKPPTPPQNKFPSGTLQSIPTVPTYPRPSVLIYFSAVPNRSFSLFLVMYGTDLLTVPFYTVPYVLYI
jgi:hypothetical protein